MSEARNRLVRGDVKPIAINPLGYFLTGRGWEPELAPPLLTILSELRSAGFRAIHSDPPSNMEVSEYSQLLQDNGLLPAPGYYSAHFENKDQHQAIIEEARKIARRHAELGLDRIFVASELSPLRLRVPAVGANADHGRLDVIIEGLTLAAQAMTSEGIRPCLHQHVGTFIETSEELEAVLAGVPTEFLDLGPDTGHLSWAGIDMFELISKHRNRIGAVHIKDIRRDVVASGRLTGAGYFELGGRGLWAEPGRGDLNLDKFISDLQPYDGWFVIEVDVAYEQSPFQSALTSHQWVSDHLDFLGVAI